MDVCGRADGSVRTSGCVLDVGVGCRVWMCADTAVPVSLRTSGVDVGLDVGGRADGSVRTSGCVGWM